MAKHQNIKYWYFSARAERLQNDWQFFVIDICLWRKFKKIKKITKKTARAIGIFVFAVLLQHNVLTLIFAFHFYLDIFSIILNNPNATLSFIKTFSSLCVKPFHWQLKTIQKLWAKFILTGSSNENMKRSIYHNLYILSNINYLLIRGSCLVIYR